MTPKNINALECFFFDNLLSDFEIPQKLALFFIYQNQGNEREKFEDIQAYLGLKSIVITEDHLKDRKSVV